MSDRRKLNGAGVVSAIAIGAAVTACGPPAIEPPTKARRIEACALISAEEVSRVLGASVEIAMARPARGGGDHEAYATTCAFYVQAEDETAVRRPEIMATLSSWSWLSEEQARAFMGQAHAVGPRPARPVAPPESASWSEGAWNGTLYARKGRFNIIVAVDRREVGAPEQDLAQEMALAAIAAERL